MNTKTIKRDVRIPQELVNFIDSRAEREFLLNPGKTKKPNFSKALINLLFTHQDY